jgi:hypothetical protein
MTILTSGIDTTQSVIPVTGTAPITGSYFTLDSEAIRFLGTSRGPDGRSFLRDYWSVDRGVAGTTAASHSGGATLTQYHPDAAGGTGSGGVNVDNGTDPPAAVTDFVMPGAVITDGSADLSGVLQFRLLGPFTVTAATPDLGDGAFLANIPAGATVIRAWPVVDVGFDNSALLVIGLGSSDFGPPDDDYGNLATFDVASTNGNPGYEFSAAQLAIGSAGPPSTTASFIGRAIDAAVLVAYSAQAPSVGSCRVYAIIAVPAS